MAKLRSGNYKRGKQIAELRDKFGSIREAAEILGVNYNTARGDLHTYNEMTKRKSEAGIDVTNVPPTTKETDAGLELSCKNETIKSLEDLLAACNIDETLWRVERFESGTSQGFRRREEKHLEFDQGKITGHVIDDGKVEVVTLHHTKAWLVRREERPFEQVLDGLIERLNDRPQVTVVQRTYTSGHYAVIPGMSDIHIGRLSADGVYTPQRARQDMMMACEAVIAKINALGMQVDRIVFPIGNDHLNSDNLKGSTTKGTWQEMSASQYDAVDASCQGHIDVIERFLDVAPVDVIMVPGNHDRYSTYWLGHVLDAAFSNHALSQYITVDNSRIYGPRKYYKYGSNLIGFEHGDELKAQDLALVMAEEVGALWGSTKYHTWLRGHWHKEKGTWTPITNHGGVHVDFFPAFCPPDDWSLLVGYIGTHRAADVRYFHREHGRAGNFPVFIDELK